MRYALLTGRQLFSIVFIIASAGPFSSRTIDAAASHGVPLAHLLVPLSGVIALAGGLSVLLGYRTRVGALLLVIFLVPVTLVMHNFWGAPDAMTYELQKVMFMKNMAMLGGALFLGYFGGGPLSLDALLGVSSPVGRPSTSRESPVPAAQFAGGQYASEPLASTRQP